MNFNQKIMIVLSHGGLILSLFGDINDNSIFNPSYILLQSVVTLKAGGQNPSSENITSRPPSLEIKVSKNSSSSVSNSKQNISPPELSNRIRYFSNENPDGSGASNNIPETEKWESKFSCPNPDSIISNVDFWNYYLDCKNQCPNIDVELDEDDDLSFNDIVEIPNEIRFGNPKQRIESFSRAYFQPSNKKATPTAKLDKAVQSKYSYSNSPVKPFSYYSKEGKLLTITNSKLEKIVYAHSDDIDLLNYGDRVVCPIQSDLKKFQRTECRAVTHSSKKEAVIRILELTTSADSNIITRKFPMPSYKSQDVLAYIDITTNTCLYFHANNNNLKITLYEYF